MSLFFRGKSGECPDPGFVRDGTPCIEDGECSNGHCLTFCEKPSVNKKPCMCSRGSCPVIWEIFDTKLSAHCFHCRKLNFYVVNSF